MKELILNILCKELKEYHGVDDIDWNIFLVPFLNSFLDYSQERNVKEKTINFNKFEIPYGNNDFITSLEKETYYYLAINNNINIDKNKISIATPNNQYINKYIFPVSNNNSIAYLSFLNRFDKALFYLGSRLSIKQCKLDFFQDTIKEADLSFRQHLLKSLVKDLGSEKKDLFELFIYMLPSIYVENFIFYYKNALKESIKLKDINVIFFIRHVFFNPTFLILLSLNKIREKKLITFQHGGVYGQTNPNWSESAEKTIATCFLTWGYKIDKIDYPFISLRFKKHFNYCFVNTKHNEKILVVLPLLFRDEQVVSIENSFTILKKLLIKDKYNISLRFDPREKNQIKFISILTELKVTFDIDRNKESLPSISKRYRTQIFITPNATGYLELINLNFHPFMVFDKYDWSIRQESLDIYQEMKINNIWIDNENVKKADLNKIDSKQKNALKKFKNRFVRTSFFPEFKLLYFLKKEAKRIRQI